MKLTIFNGWVIGVDELVVNELDRQRRFACKRKNKMIMLLSFLATHFTVTESPGEYHDRSIEP